MKSKYLLSALAIGASFAACSNEDIMVNETIATNEVVGAKLLGTGLSLNISNGDGTESRATENGWEAGKDVAGLGWVVKGAPADFQTGAQINEVGATLYSNHFYQYTEEGWNTKSNIYEGWHFAYLPYAHQAKPGELTFNVNERAYAGGHYKADIYNNAPHISAAAFLSEDNVDTQNGTITESYSVQRIVNALYPTIEVSEDFTGDELLKEIALKSITVGVTNKNQFYTSVKVNPSALPVNQYDEDGNYDKVATLGQFNNNLYADSGALQVTNNVKSITTTLAEGFKLDEKEQQLRIFLAPTRNQYMAKANLYFRIDVAGGHFDVKYTDTESLEEGQELTDIQSKNNEAIDKMFALLYGGWTKDDVTYDFTKLYTTDEDGKVVQNNPQTLKLGLGLENFTADYMVNDITDWNASVALADALGEENPVFTLYTKDGKKAEVVFDGEEISAPANGVKVIGEGELVVASDLTWNNNVVVERSEQNVSIKVDEDAQLSVVDGTLAPYRLYNNGTILADATSTIGVKGYNSLYKNNRIVVEYGAYVYPRANYEGTIAYVVPATDYYNKVATLVKTDNIAGQANVNTLIINEGVTLNCVKTTQTEGTEENNDRYNPEEAQPGSSSDEALDLTGVALEINGGTITTTENKEVTVANVTMNGGSIENVKIGGTLTAEGTNAIVTESITGDVVVSAGETTITGATLKNVTVETGAQLTLNNCTLEGNLTNNGTTTINGENTEIANIINNGTLNANTNVTVETIAVNSGSSANVAAEKTIWYTIPQIEGGYIQKGTTTGQILFYGTAQFLADLAAAEDGATVTLNSDVELSEAMTIENDITIDLNGKTLTTASATGDDIIVNADLTVKNGYIETENTALFVPETSTGKLTLENCDVTTSNDAFTAVAAFGGELVINGGTFTSTAAAEKNDGNAHYTIGVQNAKATLTNVTVVGGKKGALTVLGASVVSIEGGNYSTEGVNRYGLFVNEGTLDATITISGAPTFSTTYYQKGNVNGSDYVNNVQQ